MSNATPPARPKHPNPASLRRALKALDIEARAAARLGMTVERYRELMDDDPR